MSHLILVRHGQSEWNSENKFTGWVDVELAPQGKLEACKAGEFIKKLNLEIKHFYTSYQLRSIDTLKLILNTIRVKPNNIIKAWQLNERHYGSLTGLNKDEMRKKLGEEEVHKFRRSWDNPPKPLNSATISGIAVIFTFKAINDPTEAPIKIATIIVSKLISRLRVVTSTASNMTIAERKLPCTAVDSFPNIFMPKINNIDEKI